MKLDVAFWLLNPDGTYRCPLPDVASWKLSPIVGQPGAVQLDYPVTGANFAALREHHDADRDAGVAIWIDGRDEGSLRALLVAEDADDIDEQAVWTFTGHFTEVRLEEAVIKPRTEVVIPPSGEAPTEDLAAFRIYSATAGTIMRTLMQEAQTDGELADVGVSSFTGDTDSNGVAWTKVITLKFAPGNTFLEVLEALDEYQLCEWAVVAGELELYEPGTRGVDRTLGAGPVILRRGRDMTDSPRKRTIRGALTDLVVAGAEGLYVRVHDAEARARRGRIITGYASAGSINAREPLLAYAETKLAQQVHGVMEVTHGLALGDVGPVPLLDYGVSDWLWSDTGRPELERLQVAQITIAGDDSGEITGSVSLNDLIASRAAQLAKRISGIEGGSTIAGTSQARPVPEGPDTMPPAAPLAPGIESIARPSADPVGRSSVFVQWPAVITNADQTAIQDLEGYDVAFRYLDESGEASWMAPVGLVTTTSASWSGVRAGAPIAVRVQAVDTSGNRSQWSGQSTHTVAADDQGPPPPSAPELSSYIAIVAVSWDGKSDAGAAMPTDFHHLEVHTSTTAEFTPDRPTDLETSSTYAGLLYGIGTLPYQGGAELEPGTTLYVRLVAVDLLGNPSEASPVSSIVIEAIEDGDVAGISVSKLQAGVMSALMTVSGIIETAHTGSRVRLDQTGFRCIAPDGTEVLVYRISDGLLRLRGEVLAEGDQNAKIRITPEALPTMRLESAYGAYGPAFLNAFDLHNPTNPPGGWNPSGRTGLGINSAPSDGQAGSQTRYSRVYLAPTSANLEVISGHRDIAQGGQDPRGGRVRVTNAEGAGGGGAGCYSYGMDGMLRAEASCGVNGALLRFADVGGVHLSSVDLMQDGSILISVRNDTYMWMRPGSIDLVANGSYTTGNPNKTFVIDHPDDPDRWLVHACTESPTAGVEYTGTVTVYDHTYVELPDYFESLVEPDGRTVQLTVADDGQVALPQVAAGDVRNGRFTVRTDSSWPVRVHWHVRGTRRGTEFETEPNRSDYVALGDGPYRYLVPREG